ncbi:MAG: hypothetical protein ACREHG_05380 [Candidatus Saccharimonadales bacterium]
MAIPANAKPGDFVLVSFDGKNPNLSDPKKWAMSGGLIRLGQWANGDGFSEFEHAATYVGNGKIIEATNGGVQLNNVSRYDNIETRWSSGLINPTDAQRKAIVAAAYGYVGTPYSWPDYAALAAKRLHLGPLVPGLKTYVANSKHMICSQVVDQEYQDAGYQLFDDKRWPGYVTPGSLNGLLDKAESAQKK